MRTRLISLLLLVATLMLFAYQQDVFETPSPARAAPVPGRPAIGSIGKLDLGVTTDPLARGWWKAWKSSDLNTVNAFEREAGKHAAIVMLYADWQHNKLPSTSQLNAIAQRGSTT